MIIKPVCDFFKQENIDCFSVIPFDKTRIINQSKYERRKIENIKSVLIIAVPYFTDYSENSNISLYARPRDYHLFFADFFARAEGYLERTFGGYGFQGYADNSFIDERHAAVIGGLGVLGENGVVITEKYGSFVFLGEIFTDMDISLFYEDGKPPIDMSFKKCIGCQRCKDACPMKKGECGECLSMITQKKNELKSDEISLMLKYDTIWGCDICQKVCPMNKNATCSPIEFFHENKIDILNTELINAMNDEEFKKRAFSWRGRKTVLRNTKLYEREKKGEL